MNLKTNGGKIGLICILIVAAGLVYAFWGGGGGKPVTIDKLQVVCVETGEVDWVSTDRALNYPLENAKTGHRTMLPCEEHEDGSVYVKSRYKSALEVIDSDQKLCIDEKTLEVRKP